MMIPPDLNSFLPKTPIDLLFCVSYDSPSAIKKASSEHEPSIGVRTSLRFLKDYEAFSEAMEKAKNFWLSYKNLSVANKKPAEFSQDPDFLEAAEKLRLEIWQWRSFVIFESSLNWYYHKGAIDFYKSTDPFTMELISKDNTINLADRKIEDPLEIPDTFNNFQDYMSLEPEDRRVKNKIENLPSITEGIAAAKKYWSLEVNSNEAQKIKDQYPEEVERLRLDLWKRHLTHQAIRERDLKSCQLRSEADRRALKVCLLKTAGAVSFITSAVFFYSVIYK